MFMDAQNLFTATAMDLSTTNGSIVYGDQTINLGSTKDPGGGRPMYMVIVIDEAFASASSTGTVVFALVDEADVDICDSGSIEIVQTDPLVVTRLPLGKVIVIPIPAGLITQQYLGVRGKVGTDTIDTGTVTAFLALDPLSNLGA